MAWTGGATHNAEQTLREVSRLGITIPRADEVGWYLARHPHFADAIVIACERAVNQIGHNASLSLETYRDPEIDDETLVLYARPDEFSETSRMMMRHAASVVDSIAQSADGFISLMTDRRSLP